MANPLEELIARHGDIIGYVPVDPTIQKKVGSTTVTVPNPNPSYKYIFSNGAWAALRPPNPDNPTDVSTGQFIVTDPGTAYKATAGPTPGEKAKDDYNARYYGQKEEELREPQFKSLQPRYKPGTAQRTYVPGVGSVEVPDTGEIYDYYDPVTGKTVELNKPNVSFQWKGNTLYKIDNDAGSVTPMYTAPSEPTGQLTEYQRFQIGKYPEEQEYARSRDAVADLKVQQDRDAENMRNQLTNRTSLENTRAQLWEKTAPWLLPEEQDYFPGYEVGGPYDKLLKMSGVSNYQPYRPGRTQFEFDPNLIWRLGQTGGK